MKTKSGEKSPTLRGKEYRTQAEIKNELLLNIRERPSRVRWLRKSVRLNGYYCNKMLAALIEEGKIRWNNNHCLVLTDDTEAEFKKQERFEGS